MSGLDKNRFRNKTISFWISQEEKRQLDARIKVSGMARGQYFIQSLLHNQISIAVGKYQSDRLSLELKRLRDQIVGIEVDDIELLADLLEECKTLLVELVNVTGNDNGKDKLDMYGFGTEK